MISRQELEELAQREETPQSFVLSVYLDTDQSKAVNVERAFEVELKNMLREVEQPLDKHKREEFQEDANRVLGFLKDYREPARGLVIFCDQSADLFWWRELRALVRNGVWWRSSPYLRPLLEILDENERYGVVLTDRQQARLFTVYLGEIEEHHEAFAEADVKRIKGPGQEHAWAQLKIQHKAEEHAHWHLKHVAEMVSRLERIHEFDRLILAGTSEATGELSGLLPKALRSRIVRTIRLPVHAKESEVLEETLKIEEEVERTREAELVENLITAARKREQAVLGLDETLLALQEWRIWQLVYADGLARSGAMCTNCGALQAKKNEPCAYCDKDVRLVDDLVELAASRVVEMPGKVEQVRGPAARRLDEVGSIGALLRF